MFSLVTGIAITFGDPIVDVIFKGSTFLHDNAKEALQLIRSKVLKKEERRARSATKGITKPDQ